MPLKRIMEQRFTAFLDKLQIFCDIKTGCFYVKFQSSCLFSAVYSNLKTKAVVLHLLFIGFR